MKKLALTAVLTMGLGLAACSQETSDHASDAAESASEDMKRAADAAGNAAEDAAKAAGSAADAAAHKTTAHYLAWRDAVADLMAEPRRGEPMNGLFPA